MAKIVSSTDGVSLHLHDLGGEGPALLLAHGTGFHGRLFKPFAKRLESYAKWAPDLRGHGETEPPQDLVFRWEGFANDLLAAVGEISPHQPILGFAHSMGAAASLLAEAMQPGTFAGIYCYEPIVIPAAASEQTDPAQMSRFHEATRRRRRTFDSAQAAYENYSSKPTLGDLDEASLKAYIEHGFEHADDGSVHIKMDPDHEALVYQMNSAHPTFDRLPEITCPVVIARGQRTPFGPPNWTELIASRLPDARIEEFDDLGHMGPFQDPDGIAESARRFFNKVMSR